MVGGRGKDLTTTALKATDRAHICQLAQEALRIVREIRYDKPAGEGKMFELVQENWKRAISADHLLSEVVTTLCPDTDADLEDKKPGKRLLHPKGGKEL